MKENKPTNETGKNPETEQEKEVLPSFFQTLKTSTSKPLPNEGTEKVPSWVMLV